MIVTLFTDGGARPIHNFARAGQNRVRTTVEGWRAAWGFIAFHNGKLVMEQTGLFENRPTNNRAEMWAVVEALSSIPDGVSEVEIYSDSQYVVHGMSLWLPRWIRAGWKTRQNRTVENRDIWEMLYKLSEGLPVKWIWTPRDSCEGNKHVDRLVREVLDGPRTGGRVTHAG